MPAKKQRKSVKKVVSKPVAKHNHSFAGLLLGLIALLGCWIPFLGTILALIAIVSSRKGGFMNIIGCTLGIIALILSLAILGLVVFLFSIGFFAGNAF